MNLLKPCPFCGGEAVIENWLTRIGFKAEISCTGCLAWMPSKNCNTAEEAEKAAADAWNRRAGDE